MKQPLFWLLLSVMTVGFSQTAAITNVTAAQRTDGSKIVDIYYDLAPDTLFNLYRVTVEISMDGGSTFSESRFVTGDAGDGITAGTEKHIEWNLGAEYNDVFNNQTQVKVIATGRFIQVNFPFVVVPSGSFNYSVTGNSVNIPYDFEIMKYEVTNADYVQYLLTALSDNNIYLNGDEIRGFYSGDNEINPGDYRLLSMGNSRISWNGTTFIVEEGYGNHPVTGVTWVGAEAFAKYFGLRLPSSEEWEKTARGINNWNEPLGLGQNDSTATNFWNSGDPFDNGTTPVGYYDGTNYNGYQTLDSQSDYGAYDMAGNVSEWTSTPSIYNNGDSFIRRGGTWRWNVWDASFTRWDEPWFENNEDIQGFRCVRDISAARAQWLLEKQRRQQNK
ncbi:MAG: formylglycine-generating enzyme family protein [FCB group bacterium]|nr:formylglycine-generating enzyme family protein [FCB group bacterium]